MKHILKRDSTGSTRIEDERMKLFCVVLSTSPLWVNVIAEDENHAREVVDKHLGTGPSRANFWSKEDFEVECLCDDTGAVWISEIERG